MFCKFCGCQLPDGSSVCTNCGASSGRDRATTRRLSKAHELTLKQAVTQFREEDYSMPQGNDNAPRNSVDVPFASQPQPVQAPAAQKNDNKIVVVVLILAVILVIVAGAIGVALFSNNSSTGKNISYTMVKAPENAPIGGSSSNQIPVFSEVVASSTLAPFESSNYVAKNLCDGREDTCWSEDGNGPGIGEYVEFSAKTVQTVRKIIILNGYCKTEDLFYENCRLKKIEITIDDVSVYTSDVLDGYKTATVIPLGSGVDAKRLRITIKDVYKGSKYNDTCISGIEFE